MSATRISFRAPHLKALGLAAIVLAAAQSAALAAGPFQGFLGEWSGGGQVVGSNGHRESIRCRAEYVEAKGGAALNQTIVCASESFKLDIHCYAEASGGSVQGDWRETGRDLNGHMTGRISQGRFEGEIVGPTFTAAISLASNGRSQTISIQPRGGEISDVRIDLRRRA